MAIARHDLEKMNDLISKGMNISDVAKKFAKYNYWEIYWEVNDYSLLGKKRSISNRLKKLRRKLTPESRGELVDQIADLLNEIYVQAKGNGKKLIDIDRVMRR
jgi:hypothetical protein